VRGEAKEIARKMHLQDMLITVSHCRTFATAVAIAIRRPATRKRKAP